MEELCCCVKDWFGTATSRYISCVQRNGRDIDVGLGCCIARWDVIEGVRKKMKQIHNDIITVISKDPISGLLLTVSHCGDFSIRDPESWEPLHDSFPNVGGKGKSVHASWSQKRQQNSFPLVISSEYGGGHTAIIHAVRHSSSHSFNFKICSLLSSHFSDFWSRKTGKNVHGKFLSRFAEWNCLGSLVVGIEEAEEVGENSEKNIPLRLYMIANSDPFLTTDGISVAGDMHSTPAFQTLILPGNCKYPMSSCKSDGKGRFLAIARGRIVDIIDLVSFSLHYSLHPMQGSGLIKSLDFSVDSPGGSPIFQVFAPSEDGIFTCSIQTVMKRSTCRFPSGTVYFMERSQSDHSKWFVCTESGIFDVSMDDWSLSSEKDNCKVEDAPHQGVSFHEITCCGVDLRNGELAVGDFSGKVHLWSLSMSDSIWTADKALAPRDSINVAFSVRSLLIDPVPTIGGATPVIIGCLDGNVYFWQGRETHKLLFTMDGGVTCLIWERAQHPMFFAAGSTSGKIVISKRSSTSWIVVGSFFAHQPSLEEDSSLKHYAEVWSISWSPDNLFIASSSEDRTTKIHKILAREESMKTMTTISTLTGHTAAVTCVDWRSCKGGLILATGADDKTIRVHSGIEPFHLRSIFSTNDLEEWHTITYLQIIEIFDQNMLACGSENGYIAIWSLNGVVETPGSNTENGTDSGKRLCLRKVHAGSIEGLAWDDASSFLASCSSDCSAAVFSLSPPLIPEL